jgi:hypothetical protein
MLLMGVMLSDEAGKSSTWELQANGQIKSSWGQQHVPEPSRAFARPGRL